MIQYLTTFENETAYNEFLNGNSAPYINISHIVDIDENRYYKESSVPQNTPFTITLLQKDEWVNNPHVTFYVNKTNGDEIPTYCKYKINNGPWKTYNYNLTPYNEYIDLPDSTLQVGDSIQIINKSNICHSFFVYQDGGYTFKISGNIMSTVWGDDYVYAPANKVPYPGTTHSDYRHNGYEILHFSNIISGNILTDAGDLWLPTKNLGIYIFDTMFMSCTSLTDVPDINAKYLPKGACKNMFNGCSSLTTMPTILAETVEANAFESMFASCTSLVNTTELHVKHIVAYEDWAGHPMHRMFDNCTSLVTAPAWDATFDCVIPESHVSASNVLRWNSSFWGMFMSCTSLTSCPWHFKTLNLNFNADNNDLCMMFGNEGGGACNALTTIPTFETEVTANLNFPTNFMESKDQNLITSITFIGYEQVNSGGQVTGLDYSGNGTIYLDSNSPYLPSGQYENDYPLGLTNWTKSVYTPSN